MRIFRVILPPIVTFILLMVLWELAAHQLFSQRRYMLPAPSAIHEAARANASTLRRATIITAFATMGGFGLSIAIGVAAATALSSSRWIERAFYPFTVFLQTVPLVAIAPMLVVWCGYGTRAVVVAAFIVSVFPIIANTLTGIRSVDPALRDMFRLYGASPWARLTKLNIPSALPHLFTGLRIASGLAVIGAIVGEFIAGYAGQDAGLGILVLTCMREFRTDLLFAAIFLASLLGLALFAGVSVTGYLLLRRWHTSAK